MANRIERGKFLIIECTAGELMYAVGSYVCICDWCDKPCTPSEKGYYIAVLNHWYCKECFEKWYSHAKWYPQDAEIENKNFEYYAKRFGLIA